MVREVAPNGLTIDYEYDLEGRIKRQILSDDGVGERITAFDYDDYGRKSTETDAVGSVTEYIYDAAGNIASVTYAKGADDGKNPDEPRIEYTEYFEHDRNDRLIQKTDGEGWITRFEYDARATRPKQFRPMELTMPERPSIHMMREINSHPSPTHWATRLAIIMTSEATKRS